MATRWRTEPLRSALWITGNKEKALELVNLMKSAKGIGPTEEEREIKPVYKTER